MLRKGKQQSWRGSPPGVRYLKRLEEKLKVVYDDGTSNAPPPVSPGMVAPRFEGKNVFISQTYSVEPLPKKEENALSRSLRSGIAVKDNIATTRDPTTCASHALKEYTSPLESSVVNEIRIRHGNIIGKTNMDEFGMGSHSTNNVFGTVRLPKPFDKYSVGGSSGGSAVAVATNKAAIALGTDTGGSVRLPAAFTGIAGFKPSYGMISRFGVIPYANSLDTVGIMARSATQILDLYPDIRDTDPKDPTCLTQLSRDRMTLQRKKHGKAKHKMKPFYLNHLPELVFGVPIEYNILEMDKEVRWVWQRVLEVLQNKGCKIVPISLPNTKHALSAYYVLATAEASSNLAKYDGIRYGTRSGSDKSDAAGDSLYSETRSEGFDSEVINRILLGSYSLSSEAIDNYFIKAQKVRRLVQRDFDRVFDMPNYLREKEQFDLSEMDENIELEDKLGPKQVDFILTPTAPTLQPTIDSVSRQGPVEKYLNDIYTVPANLAGIPAISIPVDLPEKFKNEPNRSSFVGIQLMGQYSNDIHLLQVAAMIQALCQEQGPVQKTICQG